MRPLIRPTIITLIGLALIAMAIPIQAQTLGSFTLPVTSLGVTTNNTGSDAIEVFGRNYLYLYGAGTGSNSPCTHTLTYVVGFSPDGTNYTTRAHRSNTNATLAVALNGTTAARAAQRVDVEGARYIKIISIENPGADATNGVTGLAVQYYWKQPR